MRFSVYINGKSVYLMTANHSTHNPPIAPDATRPRTAARMCGAMGADRADRPPETRGVSLARLRTTIATPIAPTATWAHRTATPLAYVQHAVGSAACRRLDTV